MAKLRVLSGRGVCRILEAHGFAQIRKRGSHIVIVDVILVCLIGCIIGLFLAALGWRRKEEQIIVTIGFVSNFILMLIPLSALIGI
jgi:hypothetical protein